MTLEEITGDITNLDIDVIVNAANTQLMPGAGVSGAIHDAAGYELQEECSRLGGCDYGEVKITKGYNLPAKYVIHTVAPIKGQHNGKEPEILYSCFYSSLELADKHKAKSIAFPALGAGVFGNPYDEVVAIAHKAVNDYSNDFPKTSLRRVIFVHFGLISDLQ